MQILMIILLKISTVLHCCCSVAKSCLTPCDSVDCSVPGFPVLYYLPELAQTHVHWVGDALQLSHPLSSSSPPALNLSQHQGLFQWVGTSHQMANVLVSASASVLPVNIQGWFPLGLTGLISLHSKGSLNRTMMSKTNPNSTNLPFSFLELQDATENIYLNQYLNSLPPY